MFKRTSALTARVNGLGINKEKKSLTDLIIEKSIELYGFSPDERSDENLKWMREHGYLSRRAERHRRGSRGRRARAGA